VFPSPCWRRRVILQCGSRRWCCYGQRCILGNWRLSSERCCRVWIRIWSLCFLFLLSTATVSLALHRHGTRAAWITALNTKTIQRYKTCTPLSKSLDVLNNKTGLFLDHQTNFAPMLLLMPPVTTMYEDFYDCVRCLSVF